MSIPPPGAEITSNYAPGPQQHATTSITPTPGHPPHNNAGPATSIQSSPPAAEEQKFKPAAAAAAAAPPPPPQQVNITSDVAASQHPGGQPPTSSHHPAPPPPPINRFPLPGLSLPTDFQPILQDHHAVLYPNYATPFANAQDVVARLLPWHVWQIPQDIIALAKGMEFVQPGTKGKQRAIDNGIATQSLKGQAAAAANDDATASQSSARKRKRISRGYSIQYGHDSVSVPLLEKAGSSGQAPFERINGLEYPSMDELEDILPRYEAIRNRVRRIRHAAIGGQAPTSQDDSTPASAVFARESHLQLLNKFHAEEKAELDTLLAELKQARFNMMAQYGGIWQTELDKIAPGLPLIPRDELYNPPAPPPPRAAPAVQHIPPTPSQPPMQPPSRPISARQSPATDKADTPSATTSNKGKVASPAVSKSQSPVRQQSPVVAATAATASSSASSPATAASAANKHRKRPSIAPTPRPNPPSTGNRSQNGTPAAFSPPPPSTLPANRSPSVPSHFPRPTAPPAFAPNHHPQQQQQLRPPPPPPAPTAARPPPPQSTTTTLGNQGPIPTPTANGVPHQMPIRVILPLNLIQILTDTGIAPQPAPHLKPAIEAHKRRAAAAAASGSSAPPLVSTGEGEDSPTGGYSTAPCDPDANQVYAAVLLGITEAAVPGNPSEKYQLVHLSLKLDKLEPNQLQSLANAVNMVQGQHAGGLGMMNAPTQAQGQQGQPHGQPVPQGNRNNVQSQQGLPLPNNGQMRPQMPLQSPRPIQSVRPNAQQAPPSGSNTPRPQ
ncbi:unnamed protein product [Sympodiomycopsis kandeliae]